MKKIKKIHSSASEPKVPKEVQDAIKAHPEAQASWQDITPIARRDWMSWIDSAKQLETRRRRIEKACAMLAAGKRRPCCFSVVPMNLYKALSDNQRAKAQWRELTPMERREWVSWVDLAKQSGARDQRIEKACMMLASGRRQP